jgi:glutamate--cysteine ligase
VNAHQPDAPLRLEDLADVFVTAERPEPGTHLIGTELEKFGVVAADAGQPLLPVRHEHIESVLSALVERHGWNVGSDRGTDGEIIELVRDGASITLEPGGQFELSGKPLPDVHATCAEFTQHFTELHDVSAPLGLTWLTAGFHPWATREEINWMPKGRYGVMRRYLPTRGAQALDMMLRTCTVQANFDYTSERQCGERLRVASAIAPVVAAMFANSAYREGRRTELQSVRCNVWTEVDPDRCGIPAFVFEPGFTYDKYVQWALDVPMFFVKRNGAFHPHHVPFRTFVRDGFVDASGHRHHAVWSDWMLHLSTLFPEVRLKPHIEFRSADSVGSRFVCALPALVKGILYDETATATAWEMLADLDRTGRRALWQRACGPGLRDPGVLTMARRLVELSREALDRMDLRDGKGRTEARFLDPLQERIDRGRSPIDDVVDALGDAPGRDPAAQHAFARAFYFAGVEPAAPPDR